MGCDDVELIYQPLPPVGGSEVFADALREVLTDSPSVKLVSPYLSSTLLEAIAGHGSFRLVTDITACLEGTVDATLIGFIEQHRESIRSVRGVHAKVVLGARAALIGSANLTRTAFSRRIEMSCVVRQAPALDELSTWFEALWDHAEEALDLEAMRALRERAAADLRARGGGAALGVKGLPTTGNLGWIEAAGRATETLARRGAWLGPNSQTPSHPAEGLESEMGELVTRLRELTTGRETAERVVNTLAMALEIAGLASDDDRLFLNHHRRRCIGVGLGQRFVAWCRSKSRREGPMFGLMLDDFELAKRLEERVVDAETDVFATNKRPVFPIVMIPVSRLDVAMTPEVRESWRRAIERQVRGCGKSSYLKHKHPGLYPILSDPELRLEAVRRAHPRRAWWFGVNNGTRGHMTLDSLAPLWRDEPVWWPIGHSKVVPRGAYREMVRGERVLLWTGRGRDPAWGLIGAATIGEVESEGVILANGRRFARPVTPYPKRMAAETAAVGWLFRVFGRDFKPLGDVHQAVYGAGRTNPITVAAITEDQLEEALAYADQPR